MTERGLSRREVFATGVAAAGAAALGSPVPSWAVNRRRRESFATEGSFPSGVVAGLPGQRTLILWTRLAGHERPTRIGLEVARDPAFRNVVHRSRDVRVSPVRDNTVQTRVSSRLLAPGEEYYYRFFTRSTTSLTGRVRTRRPLDSRQPITVAVFSCQGWQPGYYNAHRDLASRDDVDLAVCLGDYIYEKTDDTGPRTDTTGREGNGFAQTLGEYREKWRLYRSDIDLQAMHAAHPFVAIPDSHEFASDDPGHIDGAPIYVPLHDRIRNGKLSFHENVPLPRRGRALPPTRRSIRLGRTVELSLLEWMPYYARGDRTALGREQMDWLKGRLEASPATWKLIGSGPMMMGLDVPYGRPLNPGQWDGYPEERRELMQHVLDRGIQGVTVGSGDIHTFFAGQVTTTGRADGTAAATEFIGGAISSEPGPEMIVGDDAAGPASILFQAGANANNPHFAYSEHRHSGYKLMRFEGDRLEVTFRAVRSKLVRPSEAFDLARFEVSAATPRVERSA